MRSTAPLAHLYVSDLNVRKTDRALDIKPLADNIAAHGLIEPLVVVDEGKGKGRLGVIAGGRRFLALQLLAASRDWPADKLDRKAIPVTVRAIEEAREISLSENVHSVAMNPVDELEAYAAIIGDYEAGGEADPAVRITRCARHFGQTERYVEQRLRLAALADEVRAALRTGAIGLDAAKAYAQVGDRELQLQIFAAQEKQRQHSVAGIRAAMAGRIYRTGDRWVRYVGVQTYVDAGGRLDRDLFMGAEDGEVVLDTVLLDRLVTAKGEPEAQRAAVEAGYAGGILHPWGATSFMPPRPPAGYQRVFTLAGLAPAERAEALALCRIAADGSCLEVTDEGYKPAAQADTAAPAAPIAPAAAGIIPGFLLRAPPAAARTGESEIEALARLRRAKIEAAALKLALPSFDGTALEGCIFMMPGDLAGGAPPVQQDETHYAVPVYIKIPKADVARVMDAAEALVDGVPPRARPDDGDWPEDPPAAARVLEEAAA